MFYYTSDPNFAGKISFVGKLTTLCEDFGVSILKESSLMGAFTFPPPNFPHNVAEVNMITSSTFESSVPWKVPFESELTLYDSELPLSAFELAYQAV